MPEGTGAEPEDRAPVARAGDLELVTLAEIGRRVGVTTGQVRQLARDDPTWPVPKEQWRRVGRSWQLPWGPIKAYFATRNSRSEPKGGTESQVLKTREAAAFLGVDSKNLSKWAKAGKVPCQKPGKSYLYSKNALLRWLAGDLEVPGPPASDNGQQPPRTARATRGRGRAARASSRQGQ